MYASHWYSLYALSNVHMQTVRYAIKNDKTGKTTNYQVRLHSVLPSLHVLTCRRSLGDEHCWKGQGLSVVP